MGDSAEYYHCGEIIVAFSPNYKDQYFMKCIECDEYFSSLEDFISHHQTIHNMKSETLSGDNESGGELEDHDVEEVLNEDVVFNVDEEFEGKERGVDVKLEFKIEDDSQNSEEDNSQNIDREEDEVKDDIEKQSEEEDNDRKDAESDDDWVSLCIR